MNITTPPVAAGWLDFIASRPAATLIWHDLPRSREHGPRAAVNDGRPQWIGRSIVPDRAAGHLIAAQLKNRPGQWAIIFTGDHYNALRLRQIISAGRRGFRYAGHYHSVMRSNNELPVTGFTDVYARFVGPPKTS